MRAEALSVDSLRTLKWRVWSPEARPLASSRTYNSSQLSSAAWKAFFGVGLNITRAMCRLHLPSAWVEARSSTFLCLGCCCRSSSSSARPRHGPTDDNHGHALRPSVRSSTGNQKERARLHLHAQEPPRPLSRLRKRLCYPWTTARSRAVPRPRRSSLDGLQDRVDRGVTLQERRLLRASRWSA